MEVDHPIVEARKRLGQERQPAVEKISQEELGDLIGVDGMTVSRWERGESLPRRKFWTKLEKLTGKPVSEIIAATRPTSEAAQ